MISSRATAWAPVNIALVKHWGYRRGTGDLPARGSLSLSLGHGATTTVELAQGGLRDSIGLDGRLLLPSHGEKVRAAYAMLDELRNGSDGEGPFSFRVRSNSEVPVSGGMASSAAGGAALAVAALDAVGLGALSENEKIAWVARTGSLSAVRSLRGGAVRLRVDDGRMTLESVATPLELEVLSCTVESRPKAVSSSEGHRRAPTSPFFDAFVAEAEPSLVSAERALAEGDLTALGALVERDAFAMHGVMLSSSPPIVYATDATWRVWKEVATWRRDGLESYLTLDAGPNPHVICRSEDADEVAELLGALPEVARILRSGVHQEGAHLVDAVRRRKPPLRLLPSG